MKLTTTQQKALIAMFTGIKSGLQSNHFINAQKALETKGLAKTTYSGCNCKTELTQAGLALARGIWWEQQHNLSPSVS